MTEFYQRMMASGSPRRTKAEALRQSQRALLADSRYAHPFYWAPFVLFGDWR